MKDENLSSKYKWCTLVLVITMTVLLIRLWDLQIMRGSEMRKLSEQNRIRVKKIVAPRGIIYDRTGKVLADTRPSFNIYLTPEDIRDFSQTVDGLARLLACDREEIIEKMKAAGGMPPSFPIKIKSDIPMDEVARVEAHRVYIPGVSIQIEPKRNYPYGAAFAHVIGYVSEISDEELKDKKKYKDYSPGDYIGKYGLERSYENDLRGVDGEKRVEVDAIGREVRTLDVVDPIPGHSLHLNLDLDLQLTADKALETRKGAAVALNPKTGGVLVLASRPGFDPNLFASGISKQDWQKIALDKAHPLQNRAIQGGYPPGSTFKILTAMRALDLGIINERTTFTCGGGFAYGNRVFRCWKKGGHGTVSVHRAIVESCDVFFYNVGLRLGVDRIHEFGTIVGLGRATGIDLPNEQKGLLPSTEWKRKRYNQPWYEGETVSVAIGQGAVWLTPVQLAQLSSFVAADGKNFKPQIVNRIVSTEGKTVRTFEPVVNADVKFKPGVLKIVRDGMRGVVNEPGGTAGASRVQNVLMCGKTGTAQAGSDKVKLGDHAWFIAYAPAEDASIAMAILVEHGLHGSSAAAPIAKGLTEALFKVKTVIKEAKANENR
ncbi:MAG: Stage V sporulation protein D [Syntrophorhabdus sp. PtaB.Bin184]|jgi:penicillin-binding protein 2|nr:MAG: Stage V sporulation protein D [Syntrophorhabdus sp. PtaB.Bin184]